MPNNPDFVNKTREVQSLVEQQWLSVRQGWKDSVASGFNDGAMVPFLHFFDQYITGEGISGLGLEQLLSQMDNHLQEMNSLL
ncbi:MAG: hypothetical protein IJK36_06895 [Bacteroidales bacterium]|nr:hypothetical protein [Bacteroidales bacterium]MBR0539937.1 hypothetical protein [Bacteroidales bacterium]